MSTARKASLGNAPKRRIRTVEGSCWQCKDQRVLCKLEKPTCSQCQKADRHCEYGRVRLRWGNDEASRGRNFSRDGPVVKACLKSPRAAMPSQWQIVYFAHELMPMFSLRDGGPAVDPVSLTKDPLLNQAVVSVSNAHYLFRAASSDAESTACKARNRIAVINIFRKYLEDASIQGSVPTVFLANVILCILDGMIEPYEGNEQAAHHHFVGGRAILERFDCLDELFSVTQGVPAVMLSVFATGDLTQAVFSGDEPYFQPSHWLKFKGSEGWWTWEGGQDLFLDLMAICSRIAHMGHELKEAGNLLILEDLAGLESALDRTCYIPWLDSHGKFSSIIKQESKEEEDQQGETWAAFCAAYRCAIRVYAYRALCNLDTYHELVQNAIEKGIAAACETEYPGKLAHCLLFPMLVLGAHCIDPVQRTKLRDTIRETGHFLSFGCVRVMDAFLNDIWSRPYEYIDWWSRFDAISKNAFIF